MNTMIRNIYTNKDTLDDKDIREIREAVERIQGILIRDISIPIESAKRINENLVLIQNKIKGK